MASWRQILQAGMGSAAFLLAIGGAIAQTAPDASHFFDNWGTGLAITRNSKLAVTDASIDSGGIVRVNQQSTYDVSFLVARHFYPFKGQAKCLANKTTAGVLSDCLGAMVGAGIGSSSGAGAPLINMVGIGLTMGGQVGDDVSTAWNFGIGFGRKFGVQTLGDGFSENSPPPAGETQIRYKTRDIATHFIYFTTHW